MRLPVHEASAAMPVIAPSGIRARLDNTAAGRETGLIGAAASLADG